MVMPTSPEFIQLCRSQVTIVVGLGASLSVVYLTEKLVDNGDTKLIPIVTYPDTAVEWQLNQKAQALPNNLEPPAFMPRLLSATPPMMAPAIPLWEAPWEESHPDSETSGSWRPQRQIALPLIHEGVVMGFLVTRREDRPWDEIEQKQIQQVAQTLTIAYILDQRAQWLEKETHLQRQLQTQQYNILHNLLHQFKSPLTALKTFGKLLLKRLIQGDKNREIAHSILRESDRLQELLAQFDWVVDRGETHLSLSPDILDERIPKRAALEGSSQPAKESSSLLLLPGTNFLESVSVIEILQPLLVSANAIAEEYQLTLNVEIPPQVPGVQANGTALREVLSNLIDNALKYTPASGQIYIKVSAAETSRLAIAISDTGVGIPSQDLEHLFERHYRGVQSETNIPGTGLGLSIARHLVEKMQGEIEVFSPVNGQWLPQGFHTNQEIYGHGTTFVVWLPIFIEQNSENVPISSN